MECGQQPVQWHLLSHLPQHNEAELESLELLELLELPELLALPRFRFESNSWPLSLQAS